MTIIERFRHLRRYRMIVRELRDYSDHELNELGIARSDIERFAYATVFDGRSR
jgi:uncharacterized protein YjiS (DUF1127 family)